MLIPVSSLTRYFKVMPKSVLHVGAHEAEELDDYEQYGWLPVIWVEAQPDKAQLLRERLPRSNHELIEAAVWDLSGISLELKVMNNSASTSLLNLGTHLKEHPEVHFSHSVVVKTFKLDDLIKNRDIDLLALDIQGAELRALKGFEKGLGNLKWIYCEINSQELYEGCCTVKELDEYLSKFNFTRVATRWTPHHWGDALYSQIEKTQKISPKNLLLWKLKQIRYYFRVAVGLVVRFIGIKKLK